MMVLTLSASLVDNLYEVECVWVLEPLVLLLLLHLLLLLWLLIIAEATASIAIILPF
jgi:hypothetical protein